MAQLGIKYWLLGDPGLASEDIVYFNVDLSDTTTLFRANYNRLELIEGLDFPTLRTRTYPMAMMDGDLLSPSFRGARFVTVSGRFVASTRAQLDTQEDKLRDVLNMMVRNDGQLRWTRRDATTRRITCRAWEPLQVGHEDWRHSFRFALIAPDPYVYNNTLDTSTDATPTTSANYTNDGDAETWPIVRVTNGATATVTAFTLTNSTEGRSMVIAGASLPTSGWLEFDMARRTVVDNLGNNRAAWVNWTSSLWWPLRPGVNAVVVSGVSGGPLASTKIDWRDAWIGG